MKWAILSWVHELSTYLTFKYLPVGVFIDSGGLRSCSRILVGLWWDLGTLVGLWWDLMTCKESDVTATAVSTLLDILLHLWTGEKVGVAARCKLTDRWRLRHRPVAPLCPPPQPSDGLWLVSCLVIDSFHYLTRCWAILVAIQLGDSV